MKTKLFPFILFCSLVYSVTHGQVGVGNTNPQAQLDISASNVTSPTNTDGILIPRVSNLPSVSSMTNNQDGMLVFYTGSLGDGKGFYYWENLTTSWVKLTTGVMEDRDWHQSNTSSPPNSITDDIFTLGDVAIGFTGTNSNANLLINSSSQPSGINLTRYYSNTATTGAGGINTFSDIQSGSTGWYYNIGSSLQSTTDVAGTMYNYRAINNVRALSSSQSPHYLYYGVFSFNTGANVNADRYGSYIGYTTNATSLGDKYGHYSTIPSTLPGTHYGVYSDVQNTNGYAAYLLGRTSLGTGTSNRYLLPESAGTNNQVMAIDNSGQVNFVDPSTVFADTDTDDQTLSLTGTTLSIADGNSVNLNSIDTDTDDQTLSLTGTTLSIADGNSVNLNSIDTDDQTLSLSGTTLSIADGNSVNLNTIDTDTDEQDIQNLSFNPSTNVLTVGIQNGASDTVDLSALSESDEIDWYEENTSTKPDDINDDIYTQGNVAIGTNTANYPLEIENSSSTMIRGLYVNKSDTYNVTSDDGTSAIFVNKVGNGTGRSHGYFANVAGSGTGQKYGIFNRVSSSANGNQYGTRNFLNGATSSNQFGTFNNLDNGGSGNQYGVFNGMRGTGANNLYGVFNEFQRNFSGINEITGVKNSFTSGVPGTQGMNGLFSTFSGSSNGNYYGSRTEFSSTATGTGNKYGSYNEISSAAGGVHYGVYSEALSANGYAGYFLGRLSIGTTTANNYIMPANRGTSGQVMTIDGTGNVSWQTPTVGDITAVNAGTGLSGGGTANSVTLNAIGTNGLASTANDIRLGGALIENTTITQGIYGLNFNLSSTGNFNIQDAGTNKLTVLDNGDTVLGGDLYWRDINTSGTILGRFIDDGDDGNLQLYENGVQSIILDTNGTTIFNQQGLDRDFRVASDGAPNMFFVEASTDRIGMNTNTPDGVLDIEANSTGTIAHIELTETAANDGGRIKFNNSVETGNYWTLYGRADNTVTDARFNLFHSTAGNVMIATGAGDVGIGTTPDYRFDTRENVATNYVAQVRNTNSGADADGLRIQLGVTTPTTANTYIGFLNGTGAFRGRITGNGIGGTTYNTTSDGRLKTEIEPITNALNIISDIEPKLYEFKSNRGVKEYGFIAQELQPVYPQAVTGSPDSDVNKDPMMVDYSRLTPILTAGVKELQSKIEKLEEENMKLKEKLNRLETLEARILALENKSDQ